MYAPSPRRMNVIEVAANLLQSRDKVSTQALPYIIISMEDIITYNYVATSRFAIYSLCLEQRLRG